MPPRSANTLRTSTLAGLLEAHRKTAGMSQVEAATALGWSQSKYNRLENARAARPDPAGVDAALALFGVPEADRAAIVDLAERARERGWWMGYRDVLGEQATYVAFEDAASAILAFSPVVIPGLLQTPQYARAIFSGPPNPMPPDEVERRVAARMQRALVLERPEPPDVQVVLGETAVRQLVGNAQVMRDQLDRLIDLASRRRVALRLLPYAAGSVAVVAGQYTVMEFPGPHDRPVVFAFATDALCDDDPGEVAWHRELLAVLQSSSLDEAATVDALAALRDAT